MSKPKLDVCRHKASSHMLARSQVPDDPSGFARLLAVLRGLLIDPARVRFVARRHRRLGKQFDRITLELVGK